MVRVMDVFFSNNYMIFTRKCMHVYTLGYTMKHLSCMLETCSIFTINCLSILLAVVLRNCSIGLAVFINLKLELLTQ